MTRVHLAEGGADVVDGPGRCRALGGEGGARENLDPIDRHPGVRIRNLVPELQGAVVVGGRLGKGIVVSRIDPATNQVTMTIPVGDGPFFLTAAGGYLWVSLVGEPTVVAINPATNAVQTRITTQGPNWEIAAGDHAVWVTQPNEAGGFSFPPQPGTVTRINV